MFPFKSFSFGATGQGPPLDDTKVRDLGDLEKLPATAHDHDFTPGRRVRLCGVGRIDVLAQNHPQRGTGHLGWRLRHGCGSADSPRPPASATSAGGSRPLSVPTAPPGCASATPATRSTASARKRPDVRVLLGGGYAVRAPLVASAAGKPSRRRPSRSRPPVRHQHLPFAFRWSHWGLGFNRRPSCHLQAVCAGGILVSPHGPLNPEGGRYDFLRCQVGALSRHGLAEGSNLRAASTLK